MIISIKKREGKKHIISYKRNLGDECWIEADDFLVMHDLSHYAIEKTLNFNSAFLGMVKSGVNPSEFENKENRNKLFISDEAWYGEYLANLFLIELTQGVFENFNQVLKESIIQNNSRVPLIDLSKDEINAIRSKYKNITEAFKKLQINEVMQIEF